MIFTKKPCTRCGEVLPLDQFHRSSRARDGHQSQCKDCQRLNHREWVRRNPERANERLRRWRADNPERVAAHWDAERAAHPEHVRARKLVYEAVRWGRLPKPTSCEECGATPEPSSLDAHHDDYSKPLEVRWLCARCHSLRHAPDREMAA